MASKYILFDDVVTRASSPSSLSPLTFTYYTSTVVVDIGAVLEPPDPGVEGSTHQSSDHPIGTLGRSSQDYETIRFRFVFFHLFYLLISFVAYLFISTYLLYYHLFCSLSLYIYIFVILSSLF